MLRQAIVKEVERRIENSESFTAYNITATIRGIGFTAFHSEVKEVVHSLFQDGLMVGFTRELRDMGGDIDAWMYIPEYDPLCNSNTPTPTQEEDSEVEYRTVDGRNTVSVPNHMIRELGIEPGSKVFVLADKSAHRLVLTKDLPDVEDEIIVSYTVNTYRNGGNVRITESTQRAAGIAAGNFQIYMKDKAIILEAA